MTEKNKKDLKEIEKNKFYSNKTVNKLVTSAAIFALLAPSFSGVAAVAAEESTNDEPPAEEVSNDDTSIDGDVVDVPADTETDDDDDTDTETETPDVPDEKTGDEVEVEAEEEDEPADNGETSNDAESATGTSINDVREPVSEDVDSETAVQSPEALVSPTQVSTGITQENLIYENGRLSLINQEPGVNIAAVLPNGNTVTHTVPYHGRWQPLQTHDRIRFFPGDTIEFFTYEGTNRGPSVFLTVEGEGDSRPEDQQGIRYSRMHFGFIPTERDSRVTYSTEPFFTVEMTFPNGHVETQVANALGNTSFSFGDNYSPRSGQIFSVRVFDRSGTELDLTNTELFLPLTTPNHSQISVWGDPYYYVNIDPNGGTIDEDYEVTRVEDEETFTLPYTFQSGLARPGYTLTGYTVEGTLLDSNGEPVTELSRFTGDYTPVTDVTLTANWEVTSGGFRILLYDDDPATQLERYNVTLVAEDGTEYPLSSNQRGPGHRTWRVDDIPNGTYTLIVDGYNIDDFERFGQPGTTSSFEVNKDGTATIELEFEDDSSTTFIRYRVYGEPVPETYTVTIDPNGGILNEDYRVLEATEGENFSLPARFRLALENNGMSIAGFNVDGVLLDANGEQLDFIPDFSSIDYIVASDVTLTTVWEETTGDFTISMKDADVAPEEYTIRLTNEDGTTFVLPYENTTRGSGGPISHNYTDEEFPRGTYTLSIDGYNITNADIRGWQIRTQPVLNDEGTATVTLDFPPNYPANHATLDVEVEPVPEVATYPLGVEVRGLNDRRTDDVWITVTNEDGEVFEGSYNQYGQWLSNSELPEGLYTITLDTPSGTIAQVNDSVTNQVAEPTDETNVFTIMVNDEALGNLSSVYGAFRLVLHTQSVWKSVT